MKCSNCDKEALFEYRLTLKKSVFYCNKDLPSFLTARKQAGLLSVTNTYTQSAVEATEQLKLDTSVPEDEQPKPVRKKAAKKKAE